MDWLLLTAATKMRITQSPSESWKVVFSFSSSWKKNKKDVNLLFVQSSISTDMWGYLEEKARPSPTLFHRKRLPTLYDVSPLFLFFGTRRKAAEDEPSKEFIRSFTGPRKHTHTKWKFSPCFVVFWPTTHAVRPTDGRQGIINVCYITTARETTFGLVFFRGSNKYATHGGLKVAKDATRVIHRPLISSRDFFFVSLPR
jgi:hypothetical protein